MNYFDVLFAKKLAYNPPLPPVIKRVTGNPVEFSDGADAPLVKCVTAITGSQDLHGYDKPWVGGAGKNKLPMTVSGLKALNTSGTWSGNSYTLNGITFTVETDNSGENVTGIKEVGTATTGFDFIIAEGAFLNGSYKLSFESSSSVDGSLYSLFCKIGNATATYTTTNQSRNISATSSDVLKIQIAHGSGVVIDTVVKPMIRLSTVTDPTFEPYSNICPITAYTEGEIEVSDGDGNVTTHTTTYPSAIFRGSEDVVNGTVGTTMIKMSAKWSDGGQTTVLGNYTRKRYILSSSIYGINGDTSAKCNVAPMIYAHADDVLHFYVSTDAIYVYLPNDTDGNTDIEVAYTLKNPTTSPVTPTNLPIKSLSGYNHIESSTGEMVIDYITDQYQNFVDTVNRAVPSTRKSGPKALDVFLSLEPQEPEPEKEEDTKKNIQEEK